MDNIKEAFQKVKRDIDSLKEEMDFLKEGLIEARKKIIELCELISKRDEIFLNISRIQSQKEGKKEEFLSTDTPTDKPENPANPTHNPTHQYGLKPLNSQNLAVSTGNEGVPTNRQTDKQTNTKSD